MYKSSSAVKLESSTFKDSYPIRRIQIRLDPLQKDNDCTLVYRDIQGQFFEVFGIIDFPDLIDKNWQEVEAVHISIKDRLNKIFIPPQVAKRDDITNKAKSAFLK